MTLEIVLFEDLFNANKAKSFHKIEQALLHTGIVGIKNVPEFEQLSQHFVKAVRDFSALPENIKHNYAPKNNNKNRSGYSIGVEKFQDANGNWNIDDKKGSYYAAIPDSNDNQWPQEVDLKSAFVNLGSLIFSTGNLLLKSLSFASGKLDGFGRMLHYHQAQALDNNNWCGAHYDHGLFTGLMPAYYFKNDELIAEPADSGLYVRPHHSNQFEKIISEKSVMLFQAGEFGQLITNDRIKATEHLVKNTQAHVERIAFALFYNPAASLVIQTNSKLIKDSRFADNHINNQISYKQWADASLERYKAN